MQVGIKILIGAFNSEGDACRYDRATTDYMNICCAITVILEDFRSLQYGQSRVYSGPYDQKAFIAAAVNAVKISFSPKSMSVMCPQILGQ